MARQRRRGSDKAGTVLLVLVLLGLAALGWAWWRHEAFSSVPLAGIEDGDTLVVERGDHLPAVLGKLHAMGVRTGPAIQWQLLARQMDAAGRIQVGEYALPAGITPQRLLSDMRDGRVIRRRFTIVEGWNIRDLRAALAREQRLGQGIGKLDDAALMEAIGAGGQHPEGRFLPETYDFVRGDTDLDLLRRAHQAMAVALDAAWKGRDREVPVKNPDELLTLASVVEKETGIAEERPQIAGVFARRLRIGMRLQTDPTVIYGMGSAYAGNITRADLQRDTPYNTYTRAGLPPTPIAMPGKAALQAAAHPQPGDALYFVAVGDGSGRHVFSRSLGEHNTAVARYVQRYRAQRAAERAAAAQ